MARKTEAIAAFGIGPRRCEELYVMTTESPFLSVRTVFSKRETYDHHRIAPRVYPGRAVAEFVSHRGVRVVICIDTAEATAVSVLLPDGVACCALPPRIATDAAGTNFVPPDPATGRCAESRALDAFSALDFEDLLGGGGGDHPCSLCPGPDVRTSAWCVAGACRHWFHAACVLPWLEVRDPRCPFCLCPVGEVETDFIRTRYGA